MQPLPLYSSTPPEDSSGRGGAVRNILSVEVHSLWMILHMVGLRVQFRGLFGYKLEFMDGFSGSTLAATVIRFVNYRR